MKKPLHIDVDQQFHGYKRGHQLLSSSCILNKEDQSVLTYLSDLSGPLEPSQTFSPYLTGYPLPSGDYYVLAKTWLDLDVERSGCVFTRSFLIPISEWINIKNVWRLAKELGSAEKPQLQDYKHSFSDEQQLIEPVDDARSILLAREFFLKDRSPLTFFGPINAVPMMMRLLQSDNSAIRSEISFCTLSLAPRSIDSKPLTLQFAPLSSRSRFARWEGTKIGEDSDVVQIENEPELKLLVDAVFLAKKPDLRVIDKSGLFWTNDTEQSASVKIVILWNRMLREAIKSPAALLGLLDISSTLGSLTPLALEKLNPIVQVWLRKNPVEFSDKSKVDFLALFFTKISNSKSEVWDNLALRTAVSSVVRQIPKYAIKKLSLNLRKESWVFGLVLSSIGDGLLRLDVAELGTLLETNSQSISTFDLLLHNRELTQAIADTSLLNGEYVATAFYDYTEQLAKKEADIFRQMVLTVLWKKEHIPLLEILLSTLSQNSMMTGIVGAFSSSRPIAHEFDDALLSNRSVELVFPSLQSIILQTVQTTEAERFIAASIVRQPRTLRILADFVDPSAERLQSIVGYLLRNHCDSALQKLFAYKGNEDIAVYIANQLLIVDVRNSISVLAHINSPSLHALEAAVACFEAATGHAVSGAAFQSIRFALKLNDVQAGHILNSIGAIPLDQCQANELHIVRKNYSSETIERNVKYVAVNWRGTSEKFPFSCEQIIPPLISHGLSSFSGTFWLSLSGILDELLIKDRFETEAGAAKLLGAALEQTSSDVSGLLEATFPIVYRALKRDRSEHSMFSLFYYTDWDKCKVARTELVRAYMCSNLPANSLILIAVEINEENSILDILLRENGGAEYLKEIEKTVDDLPHAVRSRLNNL